MNGNEAEKLLREQFGNDAIDWLEIFIEAKNMEYSRPKRITRG